MARERMSVKILTTAPSRKPVVALFDFDNTLYDYDLCHVPAVAEALRQLSSTFKVAHNSVQSAFESARQKVKAELGSTAAARNRLLYFHRTMEDLGFGPQVSEALRFENIYWEVYFSQMKVFPGAIDWIGHLKSMGVRIGLVTDQIAHIQFHKLLILKLATTFDVVVTSEEVGAEKESGKPYLVAMRKLGMNLAAEVWMFGDTDVDIGAAKTTLGATTFHFTGSGAKLTACSADVTFDDFGNLIEASKAWLTA